MNTKLTIMTVGLILIFSFPGVAMESSIKSILGMPFGEICTIKAEFVDKPNTYYAQNISNAKFYLKIIEINNKKISKSLIIEPSYKNHTIEKNKIYTFKAYETIQSQNEPEGWSDPALIQQFNYWIIQKIVIKKP